MHATKPAVLSASTLIGDAVRNRAGEDLGKIEDIMIDVEHGRIAYAVLSFGGFLGIGDKLFAIPWSSLDLDTQDQCFLLEVSKDQLEKAPGFDKDHWPQTEDRSYIDEVYGYYGAQRYW